MSEEMTEAYENAESMISAEDLDLDYIMECIDEQINELMESSSKKDYLKTFENKIKNSELAEDERYDTREAMYNDIIDVITDKFGIEIDKSNVSTKELAKNLYRFFVINYNENVEQFLEIYIIENKKDIVEELERRDITAKRVEGIQSKKIGMILNNISFVIDYIASTNISFLEFLKYIDRHPESRASTNELIDYMDGTIEDADDVIKFIMDQLVNEESGFGNIYTELQQRLFKRFAAN